MKSIEYTALLRRREVVAATISGNPGNNELQEQMRAELKDIDERSRRHTKGEPDETSAAAQPAQKRRRGARS